MMNGMSEARLEDIQLRLVGADHRPWALSGPEMLDSGGRRMICKGSAKAAKKALRAANASAVQSGQSKSTDEINWDRANDLDNIKFDGAELKRRLVLFKRSDQATDEMLDFVIHAPEDIDDLLREVFCLKEMVKKLQEKYKKATAELQTHKVSASRAEEKIVDMRRAWRTLCKEMGAKPI